MGPFHVFSESDVPAPVHKFLPLEGFAALYTSFSHASPPHGVSHAHTPAVHTPFSEQSNGVEHDARARATRVASASARAKAEGGAIDCVCD